VLLLLLLLMMMMMMMMMTAVTRQWQNSNIERVSVACPQTGL